MDQPGYLIPLIPMVLGVVFAMELFCYFEVPQRLNFLRQVVFKAISVLSTSKISDHWKEKILPCYAVRIMTSSLRIFYHLGFLVIAFLLIYGIVGMFIFEDLFEGIRRILRIDTQLTLLLIGLTYGVLRKRLSYG